MKTIIIFVLLVLSSGKMNNVIRDASPSPDPAIVIVNDVIYGNNLPSHATTCKETRVHSAPGEIFPVLYTLPIGEVVQPLEKSGMDNLGWIMIKPAQWVWGLDLCPRGK